MSTGIAWTLVFHITGIVFWIGGLLMAAQMLASAAKDEAQDGTEAAAAGAAQAAASASGAAASAVGGTVVAAVAAPSSRMIHQRTAMRLLRTLAHPGALLTLATGTILLILSGHRDPAIYQAPWLNIKLILVAVMLWLDWRLWMRIKTMDRRPARRQDASMLHGLISAVFVIILILVFLKP